MIRDEYLPASFTAPHMNDAEFEKFCAQYPDYFVEMTAEGELIIMPPNHPLTAARNAEILKQLLVWARADQRGIVTDSSGGFVLPNGARRSPDAAWVSRGRLAQLDRAALDGFWHLCPEFVIELRSRWDCLRVLRAKMREWMENGAELAWMIDPSARTVEIYRSGNEEPEAVREAPSLIATGPVAGFMLDLTRVWDPLAV